MNYKKYHFLIFLFLFQFSQSQWDYDKDNYWFEAGLGQYESTHHQGVILDLSYNKISENKLFRFSFQRQNFGIVSDLLNVYYEKTNQLSFQYGIIEESRVAWYHGTIGLALNGISERKKFSYNEKPKHRSYLSIPFEVQISYRTYGYFLNGFSIGGDYSPDRSHISLILSAGIGDI